MGRREYLERRREKRAEWAEKADKRAEDRFNRAHDLVKEIPLGQPILVGHHSEKAHRRVLERSQNNMSKGCEEKALASKHRSKADGLERQLDGSIFSDDDNAIEALEARIAENERSRERMKAINKAYKAAPGDGIERIDTLTIDPPLTEGEKRAMVRYFRYSPGGTSKPFPSYALTNLGGRIRADKKRVEVIKARAERTTAAEQQEGGVFIETNENWHGYCRITFAEKPDREVLDALKAAGFTWGGGSWSGKVDSIPEEARPKADKRAEDRLKTTHQPKPEPVAIVDAREPAHERGDGDGGL